MFLTSPLIEQAIELIELSMSVTTIATARVRGRLLHLEIEYIRRNGASFIVIWVFLIITSENPLRRDVDSIFPGFVRKM